MARKLKKKTPLKGSRLSEPLEQKQPNLSNRDFARRGEFRSRLHQVVNRRDQLSANLRAQNNKMKTMEDIMHTLLGRESNFRQSAKFARRQLELTQDDEPDRPALTDEQKKNVVELLAEMGVGVLKPEKKKIDKDVAEAMEDIVGQIEFLEEGEEDDDDNQFELISDDEGRDLGTDTEGTVGDSSDEEFVDEPPPKQAQLTEVKEEEKVIKRLSPLATALENAIKDSIGSHIDTHDKTRRYIVINKEKNKIHALGNLKHTKATLNKIGISGAKSLSNLTNIGQVKLIPAKGSTNNPEKKFEVYLIKSNMIKVTKQKLHETTKQPTAIQQKPGIPINIGSKEFVKEFETLLNLVGEPKQINV